MNRPIWLSVDLGGADLLRPQDLLRAAKQVLKEHPEVSMSFFGEDGSEIENWDAPLRSRAQFHEVELTIPQDLSALEAVRNYRDSSMGRALQAVHQHQHHAVVSCGNTGALVSMATLMLGRIQGVKRPAIFGALPTQESCLYALDLGANHECSPQDMYDFALMGHIALQELGQKSPRTALLNIGREARKGHQVIQKANYLLHQDPQLNYIGFVEPNQIFDHPCDLLVCDGFSGNLMIKSIEGTAHVFLDMLKTVTQKHWLYRLTSYPMRAALRAQLQRMNPDRYNGAVLLGLNATVVKSHAGTTPSGFQHALKRGIDLAKSDLVARIKHQFTHNAES